MATWGARTQLGALFAVCVLAATACGSTVPPTADQRTALERGVDEFNEFPDEFADSQTTQDALGGSQDQAPGFGGAQGAPGGTAEGGPDAGNADTGAAPGTPAGTSDPGPGGPLPVGPGTPGVTDTTIHIGLLNADVDARNQSAGAVGGGAEARTGSYARSNAAAVELVNALGGIAGREVVGVEYDFNTVNFLTPSARQRENQRACAHWTEDNSVFVMSGWAMTEELMFDCAVANRTPLMLLKYGIFPSQQRFESMREYWYGPHWLLADRREHALARFLVDRGFFANGQGALGGDATIAIMTEDKPDTRLGVEQALKPALTAAGYEPALEIVYPDPITSPWSTYVLRLQSQGVTHVLWSASSVPGFPALLMMRAAEDQRYRPQWGMATDTSPYGLTVLGAPQAQTENTVAMGWIPAYDVGDARVQSGTGERCAEQMRKHGQDPDTPNGFDSVVPCEQMLFLKAALERAEVLSPEGLAAGVARLGDSYRSALTIGGATRFGPGRHDGVALVREVRFEDGQWRYVGEPTPLPGS